MRSASVVPFPARPYQSPQNPTSEPALRPISSQTVRLWGAPPWSEGLTDYDRQNISLYARLLHDESEGASEDELARAIFGIDPNRKRHRGRTIVQAHLRRAHWIADTILPLLGW